MNIKYLAVALSLSAFLFAGCGSEEKKPAETSLPKAAPAQQINDKKVISKGNIVGTTKMRKNGKRVEIQVEERIVEFTNASGKKVTQKQYFEAGTDQRISYIPNSQDVTLKNKGEKVATFRSH